ncbi:MAG: AraC family transcriptional regulator ligand-binding domain-containing protein [Pseudomonadota bacterium]
MSDKEGSEYTHIENTISLMRGCLRYGVQPEHVFRAIDVDPSILTDPNGLFPRRKAGELLRTISSMLQDETLGFMRRKTKLGAMALAIHAVIGSENLYEASLRWQAFWETIHDEVELSLEIHGDEAHFSGEMHWATDVALDNYAFVVWISFLQLRVFMWLVGKPILVDRVGFLFPPPPHSHEFSNMFPTRIYFEQETNLMVLNKRYLDMPVVQRPGDALDFIGILPDLMINQWVDHSVTGRVSRLLRGANHLQQINFDSAAAALFLAPDTLRRKLKREGYTFKEIKESVRRDIAIYHLQGNKLQIAEIAYLLGFSEPSTFNRAFKRWTGKTPGEFRNT